MPKGRDPPFLTKLIVYREGLKHTAHGVKITLGLVFWGLGCGLGCWRAVLPLLLSIRPPILSILPADPVDVRRGSRGRRRRRKTCRPQWLPR